MTGDERREFTQRLVALRPVLQALLEHEVDLFTRGLVLAAAH